MFDLMDRDWPCGVNFINKKTFMVWGFQGSYLVCHRYTCHEGHAPVFQSTTMEPVAPSFKLWFASLSLESDTEGNERASSCHFNETLVTGGSMQCVDGCAFLFNPRGF